jgi:hypothetical protein
VGLGGVRPHDLRNVLGFGFLEGSVVLGFGIVLHLISYLTLQT